MDEELRLAKLARLEALYKRDPDPETRAAIESLTAPVAPPEAVPEPVEAVEVAPASKAPKGRKKA